MTWCSSQCVESTEEDYWSVNVAPPVCQLSVHLAAGPAPRPEHFPTGDLPLLPPKIYNRGHLPPVRIRI